MYFFIQKVKEFNIKDLLFKRYSNVNELLGTFNDFKDLKEYLENLLNKSMDEEMYEYYIHKSILSDVSFEDFKNSVMQRVKASQMTDKEVDLIMNDAFQYIEPRR
ncbi:hypothetical protein [Clostridium sp. UBA1652]|uniref:hypothetical protein n=1 Tax=Clostridium sp. UBA1652 TaxID=1946348 RepID=UPI00257EE7A4|nr:hypothetical protein [Clostridium sp. UBA1652]